MKYLFNPVICLVIILMSGCATTKTGALKQKTLPINARNSASASSVPTIQSDDPLEIGFQTLVNEIVAGLQSRKATKIAVMPFEQLNGSVTELGGFIAEEMITRLYRTGSFRVVERGMLNQVMAEHKLSISGLVDESTAKKLGKLLGVDAIATGTITDLGSAVRVNSRLIATETGSVFSAAAITLPNDERILNLMHRTLVRSNTGSTNPSSHSAISSSKYSQGASEPGLLAEYFNLKINEKSVPTGSPIYSRIDATINFQWGGRSPVPRINSNWFAVRWTGYINITKEGIYSLRFFHDDSLRIWIDGKLVYNGSVWTNGRWKSIDYSFDKLGWVPFRAEFIEFDGGAHSTFRWALPGDSDYTDVTAEYFRHDAK